MKPKYVSILLASLSFIILNSEKYCLAEKTIQKQPVSFNVVYINGFNIPFGNSSGKKIYAIWAETTDGKFIQNLWVCQNSIKLPSRKMPSFWYANVREKASKKEIDAVTGATHFNHSDKNINFTINNILLKDSAIRLFYVYFEIDRSWDKNDWFNDQPAILYKTLVNFDSNKTEFILKPVGWTAGPMNEIGSSGYIPGFSMGRLNHEMRYITNLRNTDNSIGKINPDSSFSALSMTGSIKITLNK